MGILSPFCFSLHTNKKPNRLFEILPARPKPETHDYQLYLAINDIEHSRTKANHPQTNGICERFHKTILQEFYQVAFRRKIYRSIEELQIDLDDWLHSYNHDRTHQGKMCCGRTPIQTLIDGKEVWNDKITALNS
jgi:Integrase core domain